jgi:RsiW-degrading membrane proteinase PrsW (M82 family)
LESRGAAITVAMVAVATGFSCAENFIYVFVYTDGIAAEANTLIMRALFPVHPLCAAIQSIAVVRRDLENDTSIGVGRILLGAWLLHGIFDFLLMTYSAISGVADPSSGSKEEQSVDTVDWIVMGCVILIPLIGLEYYFYHAQRQTKRLRDLDSGRISTNTAAPVTAVI